MEMSNKCYNILEKVCRLWLPALATLYFTLSQIWGLSYGEEIVGTITAIDTFLGICLGISASNYDRNRKNEANNEADKKNDEEIKGKHFKEGDNG